MKDDCVECKSIQAEFERLRDDSPFTDGFMVSPEFRDRCLEHFKVCDPERYQKITAMTREELERKLGLR